MEIKFYKINKQLNKYIMNKTMIFLYLLVASTTNIFAGSGNDNYTLNAQSSKFVWKADKVTGSHSGDLHFKSGNLITKDEKLIGGSFEVDMSTINDTDLEGEWKQKMDKHLKSESFFNIEKFATSKFEITNVEYIPTDRAAYKITGKLTIMGVTNEISFSAKVSIDGKTLTAQTEFKIDRTKWGIKYNSGQFYPDLGDKMIYDDFLVTILLVAEK